LFIDRSCFLFFARTVTTGMRPNFQGPAPPCSRCFREICAAVFWDRESSSKLAKRAHLQHHRHHHHHHRHHPERQSPC
jgi:hypothetical protein